MSLSVEDVENLAPDQASLKLASKLVALAKWPLLAQNVQTCLIWGECQGSGSIPYRVVVDETYRGYKCSCPSRKFPCKHVLALMWVRAQNSASFTDASLPDWVTDWTKRRRSPTSGAGAGAHTDADDGTAGAKKSVVAALAPDGEKRETPGTIARKQAARNKRAAERKAGLKSALVELETWIADQARMGLSGFLDDMTGRCRNIAARLVDFKAQGLASRLDELPSRLLALPIEERTEAAIAELGKLVLLARAWQAAPDDPQLMRTIATSETRDQVLDAPDGRRVSSVWEVLGERINKRRDGLVSHATWLMDLRAESPVFALLLDYSPASAGARGRSFRPNEQFEAEVAFYSGDGEERAILVERRRLAEPPHTWKALDSSPTKDPLAEYRRKQDKTPWNQFAPMLLGASRLAKCEAGGTWLKLDDQALPLSNPVPNLLFGVDLIAAGAVWDGTRLDLLSAQTSIGKVEFEA